MRNKKSKQTTPNIDSPFCAVCPYCSNCQLLQISLKNRKLFCHRFTHIYPQDEKGVAWYEAKEIKKLPIKNLLPGFVSEHKN